MASLGRRVRNPGPCLPLPNAHQSLIPSTCDNDASLVYPTSVWYPGRDLPHCVSLPKLGHGGGSTTPAVCV